MRAYAPCCARRSTRSSCSSCALHFVPRERATSTRPGQAGGPPTGVSGQRARSMASEEEDSAFVSGQEEQDEQEQPSTGEEEDGEGQAEDAPDAKEYEAQRQARIQRNRAMLMQLAVSEKGVLMHAASAPAAAGSNRSSAPRQADAEPCNSSARVQGRMAQLPSCGECSLRGSQIPELARKVADQTARRRGSEGDEENRPPGGSDSDEEEKAARARRRQQLKEQRAAAVAAGPQRERSSRSSAAQANERLKQQSQGAALHLRPGGREEGLAQHASVRGMPCLPSPATRRLVVGAAPAA